MKKREPIFAVLSWNGSDGDQPVLYGCVKGIKAACRVERELGDPFYCERLRMIKDLDQFLEETKHG